MIVITYIISFLLLCGVGVFITSYYNRKDIAEIVDFLKKEKHNQIFEVLVSKDVYGNKDFFGSNYKSNIIFSDDFLYVYPARKHLFSIIKFPLLVSNFSNNEFIFTNSNRPFRVSFYSDHVHIDYKEFSNFSRLIINFNNKLEMDQLRMISEWIK